MTLGIKAYYRQILRTALVSFREVCIVKGLRTGGESLCFVVEIRFTFIEGYEF